MLENSEVLLYQEADDLRICTCVKNIIKTKISEVETIQYAIHLKSQKHLTYNHGQFHYFSHSGQHAVFKKA